MSSSASALVAEIKTLYGRRHEEKLQIQKDMVALEDAHGWKQDQIVQATGIPQPTVSRWITAYREYLAAGDMQMHKPRLTPEALQDASDVRVAARVLAHAPAEVVERVINELPKERQKQVGAAAGHAYLKARVSHDERERGLTSVERKEREANRSTIHDFAAKVTSPFVGESIVILIEEATEKLQELIAADVVTPEINQAIGEALTQLNREYEVSCAMTGLEVGP